MTEVRYERPATTEAACALLAEVPGARVLSGGTDLVVDIRFGVAHPDLIVDIKRIPGIAEIRWTEGGDLVIGAGVTMYQLCHDPQVAELYPGLSDGAGSVGSVQVRYRATIGGNLCNASPCMDTAPPLLVLDAVLRVAGVDGSREVALRDFFVGVKQTSLARGEMATEIVVPAASKRWSTAFDKVKRGWGHDLALVNTAVAYDAEAQTMRAAVGSCGVIPFVTDDLEGIDPASADPAEVGNRLAAAAQERACPIDDVRASAEYRIDMIGVLCRRLAKKLLTTSEGRG